MKIDVIYLEHNRITKKEKKDAGVIEFSCDWCDSIDKIEFNTYIDYLDEFHSRQFELHYLCAVCILKIMKKYIKQEAIEI